MYRDLGPDTGPEYLPKRLGNLVSKQIDCCNLIAQIYRPGVLCMRDGDRDGAFALQVVQEWGLEGTFLF